MKVIVAGAHPDDPESACGGTISRHAAQGDEVICLYLTRGEAGITGKTYDEAAKIRTAEAEAACKIMNARPRFFGQIDGAAEINAAAYDTMNKIIDEEKPDLLITHWPIDTHRDHRVIAALGYDAWLNHRKSFTLAYLEVLSGGQTQCFRPTHYVDITATEPKKRAACLAHHSQDPGDFYPYHMIMQTFRGKELGTLYAEAFVILGEAPKNWLSR